MKIKFLKAINNLWVPHKQEDFFNNTSCSRMLFVFFLRIAVIISPIRHVLPTIWPWCSQTIGFQWSDVMWLLKVNHKNVMHFHHTFSECSALEASHHAVRKSQKPTERPTGREIKGPSWQLWVNSLDWVNRHGNGSFRPQSSCPILCCLE